MRYQLDDDNLDVYRCQLQFVAWATDLIVKIRAMFFDDARGSATECASCLDALVAKRACSQERVEHGKAFLVRIVPMLTKLVERFSPSTQVREVEPGYLVEDEDRFADDEDDDEKRL